MTALSMSKASPELDAVPWVFTNSSGLATWTWLTEHFVARIVGQMPASVDSDIDESSIVRHIRFVDWEVGDLIHRHQDMPRVIVEGRASHFDQAEVLIRENVAKAYEPTLGYRRYAGPLAFTFELASGQKHDVSDLIGRDVQLRVLQAGGSERVVRGEFGVHGYRWRVVTPGGTLEVVPEHVVEITGHGRIRASSNLGIGRIHRDSMRAGCTGAPGFAMGTIDHAGKSQCPIHEDDIAPHLLG